VVGLAGGRVRPLGVSNVPILRREPLTISPRLRPQCLPSRREPAAPHRESPTAPSEKIAERRKLQPSKFQFNSNIFG